MIELFPFTGLPVAVLGLGAHGRKTADALVKSGAEVVAWDDDPRNREMAAAGDIPVGELGNADWRDFVSLVIQPDVPHLTGDAHPVVSAARDGGCEVISDVELLARAQRDAKYVGVVSRNGATALLDVLQNALSVSGRDCEAGGDDGRPVLGLHPLELGGVYILAMPPDRLDITMSITFDVAVLFDVGPDAWPPFDSIDDTVRAAGQVFRRQTGEKGAVVNVDDKHGRAMLDQLQARNEQVVIPISGRARAPGGVYMAEKVLFDDIVGNADAVVGLELAGQDDVQAAGRLAAAAYATLIVLDVPAHAAMASIRSYFDER